MSHVTFEEEEALRELKKFAGDFRKYPTVVVPTTLFLKLLAAHENGVADRAILGVTAELARLAVSRGWGSKEFRAAHEGAYADAIGELAGDRVVTSHGAPKRRPAEGENEKQNLPAFGGARAALPPSEVDDG